MKKLVVLSLSVLAVIAVTTSVATAGTSFQRSYEAMLNGVQEVPDAVETRTTGRAILGFSPSLGLLKYSLEVFRGEDVTQAHLHCAAAGENGPVVAFLFDSEGEPRDVNDILTKGFLSNDDVMEQDGSDDACPVTINNLASLLHAVREGYIYVNVHTEGNPSGEIRGQVLH